MSERKLKQLEDTLIKAHVRIDNLEERVEEFETLGVNHNNELILQNERIEKLERRWGTLNG